MNVSYVLLVALLVAVTLAIYGTYLYLMNNIRSVFAENVDIALKYLLATPIGAEREAVLVLPQGYQMYIYSPTSPPTCASVALPQCNAATCIAIFTPAGLRVVTADVSVEVVTSAGAQSCTSLTPGVYTIKAWAVMPSPEKVSECTLGYLLLASAESALQSSSICQALSQVGLAISQQICGTLGNTPYVLWKTYCTEKIILKIS
ncbi:hypothetical protein TUZN_0924 [Thermoproteus uzoniensis 768-20]|uniref:Uncharacterized protein n=1 Tax=Thermoproteus uzoniensis (strain 768-20) TaxID=999630 RepID=F2L5W2_THEU7|nr:hypothetical protein [Thermoproteus uzoniensis]AEA12407.1 hypothetical protein TUZN_0924 [Thermoproteus uzoniensis 768-20]